MHNKEEYRFKGYKIVVPFGEHRYFVESANGICGKKRGFQTINTAKSFINEQLVNKHNHRLYEADGDEETTVNTETTDNTVGNDANTEFKKIETDLKNAKSYDAFVNSLNKIMGNAEQFKIFKDGLSKIDTASAEVQEGTVPVTQLLPTQSEIDASNSLIWFLNGKGSKDAPNDANVKATLQNILFNNPATPGGEDKRVITFNGKYIIDGHHRWSQAYCANKDNKIKVINFKFPNDKTPTDALKRFQVAIAATTTNSKLPSAEVKQGLNLYSMDENSIKEYVTSNICDLCVQLFIKKFPNLANADGVINYIVGNCMSLKNNNKPIAGAPNRTLMPQTNQAAIDKAGQAITDFTEALTDKDADNIISNIKSAIRENYNDLDDIEYRDLIGDHLICNKYIDNDTIKIEISTDLIYDILEDIVNNKLDSLIKNYDKNSYFDIDDDTVYAYINRVPMSESKKGSKRHISRWH